MQIAVTFRHMEVDEGVRDYVNEKVKKLEKYIDRPREAHVVLSEEKFRHTAEIVIFADGMTLNSQGKDNDLHAAIDQMVDKMERQIRGRQGKVKRKRTTSSPKSAAGTEETVSEAEEEGEEEGTEIPPLIQRRRVVTKPMSLEEAVAQLHLSKTDYLFFVNSDSGQMNALYRNRDGELEWVEPQKI